MKKRTLANIVAILAVGFVVAACSDSHQTAPQPTKSTTQVIVQTSAPALSESDQAYLNKLRVEQPKIFTGCPGQGNEQTPSDVKPNLQVVGLVQFITPSADYPYGTKLYEYTGAKVTQRLHTEPGWKDNVTVTWSYPAGIEAYSLIMDRHQIDNWVQSMQHERGVNQNSFNMLNYATATGDRWFIMGYNPAQPCAGRQDELYGKVNWTQLFKKQELDLERRR